MMSNITGPNFCIQHSKLDTIALSIKFIFENCIQTKGVTIITWTLTTNVKILKKYLLHFCINSSDLRPFFVQIHFYKYVGTCLVLYTNTDT